VVPQLFLSDSSCKSVGDALCRALADASHHCSDSNHHVLTRICSAQGLLKLYARRERAAQPPQVARLVKEVAGTILLEVELTVNYHPEIGKARADAPVEGSYPCMSYDRGHCYPEL
jgi:hypothetical protein